LEILGIIPARGGSKGIPRKNLAPVLGRPLIAYTFDAARASKRLSRLILSTDDNEISALGRSFGIEVPFLRPPFLATDDTPMLDVIRHALSALPGYSPDLVVLLQPTSPLRTSEDIDRTIDVAVESGADSTVTVVEVPHQYNPGSVLKMSNGIVTPWLEGPLILNRQDKPAAFARNGPAVLVMRREVIESGRLYGDVVRGVKMSLSASVDVDNADDLAAAEWQLQRKQLP
jgi:CMP-N-acetylneuraminic acid synthetase